MAQRLAEYAEFYVLDPTKMAQGVERATVMQVGVLLNGAPIIGARNRPHRLGPAINSSILQLEHTPEGRAALQKRASISLSEGMKHFYYCALCAGTLGPTGCTGACKRRYSPPANVAFNMLQPVLPLNIAAYIMAQGHRFTVLP